VDDIIYDSAYTSVQQIFMDHNNMHKNTEHKLETENKQSIHFLYLDICRKADKIKLGIFHTPTHSDKVIHNISYNPLEHKLAAFNYILHRANSLSIMNITYEI
jgi:hypothetical protein